jgi:putative transposase
MPTRQTVREIQAHLEEMYGAEVSPTLISTVTDAVMDEAKAWQSRPLDALYPIVCLDCIHDKSRDAGVVKVKAVYLALGIDLTGNMAFPQISRHLRCSTGLPTVQ